MFCIFAFGFFYYRYSENERHKFKVTFLNIGQGDAALIQFENGEKMLVDCGPNKIILSALGRNMAFYDRRIDYLLSTHPDLDHYGGCIDVVRNYQVKKIITNGREKQFDSYWREWDKARRGSGAELAVIDKPVAWSISSDTLRFISPDPTLPLAVKEDDNNNYSIVFRLMHNNENFLFTGDMEEPLERLLVNKYCQDLTPSVVDETSPRLSLEERGNDTSFSFKEKVRMRSSTCPLQSNILKVGHHGSDGASSELFLSFVKPKIAVISVGKNKYGHPTLRAIRHLERAGAEIRRTDLEGDIVVR
ncbi:MAG: MBL fold metallo-hydrolase [Patescibacteria group bacterium]